MTTNMFNALRVYVVFVLVLTVVQNFRFSAGCLEKLTTDTYPPLINFTGNSCTWKITAPVTRQRVVLTVQRFQLQTSVVTGNSCQMFLHLSDEVGAVTTCPKTNYPEYISDGNFMYLSLNSSTAIDVATLMVKIEVAEEVFFCDFDPEDSCTREVDEDLLWQPENGLNVEVCPLPPTLNLRGLFYQITRTPSLFTKSLAAGGYLLRFDIEWICESNQKFQAKFLVTTCRDEPLEIAVDDGYANKRHYVAIVRCEEDFDLVLGPLEFVSGLPSIFIDNVLLMSITESGPPKESLTTIDPTAGATIKSDQGGKPLSEPLVIVAIAVASAFIILVLAVICICLLVRCRTNRRSEDRAGTNTKINFDNQTYDIQYAEPLNHPYEDAINANDQQYQDVNDDTSVTDNGRTINTCENATYESYTIPTEGNSTTDL